MSWPINQQIQNGGTIDMRLVKDRVVACPNCLIQFRVKRRGELAKTLTNLRARPRREAKCECRLRLYFHKTRRQRRRPDTDVSAYARDHRHVFFLSHPGDEM